MMNDTNLNIRINSILKADLQKQSLKVNRTMSNMIIFLISEYLESVKNS